MCPDMINNDSSLNNNINDNMNDNINDNMNENMDDNTNDNISNNDNEQNSSSRRSPYLFFLPNFLSTSNESRNRTENSSSIRETDITNRSNSANSERVSNNTNTSLTTHSDSSPPTNRMERLSDEPDINPPPLETVSNTQNESNSRMENSTNAYSREPRRLASFDRTSSYGILSSSTSLFSIDDTIDEPLGNNGNRELNDGSTQNLISLLDRIHRINLLSRAIEEERRRQRELEHERERERQREVIRSPEQNELSSFVNLLNTMIFLLSADRQLRRPLMMDGYPNDDELDEDEMDDEEIERRRERFESGISGGSETPRQSSQSEIRYIRPNPNPIITTPFMYTRFEPEGASTDETNTNEENSNNTRTPSRPYVQRSSNNLMFINIPLSFDLTNLIQLLSASSSHRHPGTSKEAMKNSTRILTPEMMKFGTRLQTQPNCIICQEDFITNVNKRLRSKSSLLKEEIKVIDGECSPKEEEENVEEGKVEDSETKETKETDKEVSTDDDNIRLMPCGHIFHETCIFQWLKDNNTCPVCRYELETDDEEYNEGVHKRMAERGIDIPAFNIDFTFFCSLEKCGQCKYTSNRLKRRLESHSLSKCSSIENIVSHSITNSKIKNMRYTRLPRCNHEFHWPCLKEALIKAGYQWEDEDEGKKHERFFIPKDKKSFLLKNKNSLKNKKKNILNLNLLNNNIITNNTTTNTNNTITNDNNITTNENNTTTNENITTSNESISTTSEIITTSSENITGSNNKTTIPTSNENNTSTNENNLIVENDIIITDLEEEEEEEIREENDDNIDYSIQSSSRKPTVKKDKTDEWIEIKCPVCMKINKIQVESLKSKEHNQPATMSRSISLNTLPKAFSIEKLEFKRLTTYNNLFNMCNS